MDSIDVGAESSLVDRVIDQVVDVDRKLLGCLWHFTHQTLVAKSSVQGWVVPRVVRFNLCVRLISTKKLCWSSSVDYRLGGVREVWSNGEVSSIFESSSKLVVDTVLDSDQSWNSD